MTTVQVFCPTRGRVRWQTAQALTAYNTSYVWGPRGIADARNRCRQMFLSDPEAQVLVMVDDDVVPHPDALIEGLSSLMSGECDAIAFPCPIWRQGKLLPNIYRFLENPDEVAMPQLGFYLQPEADEGGLASVDAAGFGCIAIPRRVLRSTGPFATFADSEGIDEVGEDIDYCVRMKRLGYQLKAHMHYLCEHHIELPGSAVAQSFAELVSA